VNPDFLEYRLCLPLYVFGCKQPRTGGVQGAAFAAGIPQGAGTFIPPARGELFARVVGHPIYRQGLVAAGPA